MKKRIISVLLSFSMIFSITSTAFASTYAEDPSCETYVQEIADGNLFIQRTSNKLVAIATGDSAHILDISILYTSDPNVIYHWFVNDYPVTVFSPNDSSFWADIIEYVEERTVDADLIESPTIQEIDENEPMVLNSAEADMAKDMEAILGPEYTNKFISSKTIGGCDCKLYESLEFCFSKVRTMSWSTGLNLSSFVVSVIGLAVTSATLATACTLLGLATSAASQIVPPGKLTEYLCSAIYVRFVKINSGSIQYGQSYKVMYYAGFEETSGRGRATVFSNSGHPGEMNPSEEYYNNGIFYDAYNQYSKG